MDKCDRKIICLTGLFPDDYYNELVANSRDNIQYAADALQKSIVSGLSYWSDSLKIVNLPYVGSFPNRFTESRVPSFSFVFTAANSKINAENIGFCNYSGIKLISRYLKARQGLRKVVKDGDEVLLIYAIHIPFVKACVDVKKENPGLKIVLLVPDLPEFMSPDTSFIRRVLNRMNKIILDKLYKSIDGYVLLSEHMTDRLPIVNKPWTIMEGIYDNVNEVESEQNTEERYILYTGTLAKRYGVMRLVEAFSNVSASDVKLYICGEGDAKDQIINVSKKDPRIVYRGLLKREEALSLQKNAILLVNPRTPEGEFTKYSFPSKTMEYLASGVPTLLYRLPGIPDEYYEYCYSMTNLSIEALTNELEKIINMDSTTLKEIGSQARLFILDKKNPKQQTKKIIDLINKL